jgi:hypothetical protein
VTAKEQLAQIAAALRLPEDADLDQVVERAAGLVAGIDELRRRVYVGIVDGALAEHNVTLNDR